MIDLEALQNAVVTHCEALGVFEQVITTEPENAAMSGTVCTIMFTSLEPYRQISGLDITSAKVKFTARVWKQQTSKPNDGVDLNLLQAVERLINSLHEDITLGDEAMNIEILTGDNFGALAGWAPFEEGIYRVVDVTIPISVADVWQQERS